MATHYIPRNVKGEGRLLLIFSVKALITTAIGGAIGFIFYMILKTVGLGTPGLIVMLIFSAIGYAVGTVKIPRITALPFTKNVMGDSIDTIIVRFFKFRMNKKVYSYFETKEEEVDGDK